MSKELTIARDWTTAGHSVVIACVARTWGSAPRRAGSMMVVRGDGAFEGSVSGGCVEGSVIEEALALLSGKTKAKTLTFSVASEDAWQVGLACGGEIEICLFVLEQQDQSTLADACEAVSKRMCGLFVLGAKHIEFKTLPATPPKTVPFMDDTQFIVPLVPSIHVVIIGAVHIAQHLAVMAHECEFSVTIIDPRSAFADNRHFADATIVSQWPDDFFASNPPDANTAIVTLTHDPKLDDAALHATVGSSAFYIGCLGSRKTHAARLSRLQALGHAAAPLGKINGPVGLDIGAATPAEIATAVLAQIIQTARKQS